MSDAADAPDLQAIDEVLQVLFWLRGEGIAADVEPRDLVRLTTLPEPRIRQLLERLAARGLIQHAAGRYALTDAGAREGGRRFADEFAGLTGGGHGECSDPECDCHETGSPADCRHRLV